MVTCNETMAVPPRHDDRRAQEREIQEYLRSSADVKRATAERCAPAVAEAARLLCAAIAGRGRILLCGNGGSAADCQHMAAEFVSRLTADFARPAIAAIALTTDT